MGARGKFVVRRRPLSLLVAAAFIADPALAQQVLPTGGTVTSGSATISQPAAGRQVIDQSSTRAIIDWQSFSIGAGNSVVFRQPGASSIALNRVVGNDASSIFGSLSANGQVFLVNPNGIYFGRGATVDTAGFFASTLDIRNEDFLAGRYVFARREGAPAAAVTNEGILRAVSGGYVVLAGDRVANRYEGLVEARLGTAALASGSRVTLDIAGDHLVNLSVDAPTTDRLGGVQNAGTLAADGGRVVMSAMAARDVAGAVVNNTGLVRATGIESRNGVIELTGNGGGLVADGTLDASGASGGNVRIDGGSGTTIVSGRVAATGSAGAGGSVAVLGDRVGLDSTAIIDASGTSGGGTVLVGGDAHGANPGGTIAQRTYVASGARIDADAGRAGDGGKVVVWGDDWTRFEGSISARGGAQGGNGGWVEVSGKRDLAFAGTVDTRAPTGSTGSLLLDPADITIQGGSGGTGTFTGSSGTVGTVLGTDAAPSTIFENDLEGIGATTNVTVQATNNITFAGTFNGNVDFQQTSGHSVVFDAGNTLNLANVGLTTQGGSLALLSHTGQVQNVGALTSNGGNITVESGDLGLTINSAINAGSGSVVLETREASTATQTLTLNNQVTGSSVFLHAADGVNQTGGAINATNLVVRFANGASGDTVSLTGANNVANLSARVEGSGTTGNSFSFSNAAGVGLTIASIADPNASLAADTGSNPPLAAATITGITSNLGNVTLVADSIAVNQAINAGPTSGGGSVVIRAATASRAMTLGANTANTLALDQSELNLVSGSLLRIGDSAASGAITIAGAVSAPTVAPGTWNTLSLKTTGSVTQNSGATLSVPNLAVEASGSLSLTNGSTAAGSFAAVTAGDVAYTYGSSSAGAVTVGAAGGIDGVNGVTAANATVAAGGKVTLQQDITAAGGTVKIVSGSAGASEAGGKITAANLLAQGTGAFDFSGGANNVDTIAAAVSGSFSYTDADKVVVGTVGSTSGIVTAGNSVTIAADGLDIGGFISTSGGGVTIKTTTAARAIDLGNGSDAGQLGLTAAEIGNILAGSGSLTFGSAAQAGGITVSAPIATPLVNGGLALDTSGGGSIAINSTLSSGGGAGFLTLKAAGSVSDIGGTSGVAGSLLNVQAGTGISLAGSATSVSAFVASNSTSGAITLVDNAASLAVQGVAQSAAADITISNTGSLTVSAQPVSTPANGNISLTSGGAMTLGQSVTAGGTGDVTLSAGGGLNQTGGVITADQLLLTGAGAFSLTSTTSSTAAGVTTTNYNNANTLAANIAGSLDYREENALTIGTIGTTSGITTNGNLTIVTGGQKTAGPGAATSATGGALTVAQSLNAGTGVITLTANSSGLGSVNQTGGAITGATLLVTSAGGAALAQAGNDVDTLAVTANGPVSYVDADGFTVGATGITSNSGNVTLAAGGAVALTANVNAGAGALDLATTSGGYNQTAGALTGGTLRVAGAGPFSLAQAGNNVGTLAASVTGNFTYTDADSLTIGTVGGASGVQSTDNGNISITAQNGALTVNQAVLSGPALTIGTSVAGTRGNVGLTAFGATGNLALNADVAGNELRLFADHNLGQSGTVGSPLVEAATLLQGSDNNPTLRFNGAAPSLTELVYNFEGSKVVNENLVANRLILRSTQDGSSIAFGPGFSLNTTELLLIGNATFNLANAGNDTTTLASFGSTAGLLGPINGGTINYTDQNSVSVGTITSGYSFFGVTPGIGNTPLFGAPTNVALVASGTGGTISLSQPLTATGAVSLTAQAGISQTPGARIAGSSLAISSGGTVSLGSGSNDVDMLAASLANLGSFSYVDANNLAIGTVGSTVGISASGPGQVNVSVAANGALSVTSPITVTSGGTAAAAQLSLSADQDISISQNVTVTGGSVGTGNGALVQIFSGRGGVLQTAGTISATDNGPVTTSSQAPHLAMIDIRAAKQRQDSGQSISGCGSFFGGISLDGGSANCGAVSLNGGGVSATSTNGRAVLQVRGPKSIASTGALTATSATAPFVSLSADVQNSNGDVVSQGNVNVAGAITAQQTATSDQNNTNRAPAGILVSGNNLTLATVTSNSLYGMSFTAANNITMNGNVSTTSNDGVSLTTSAALGTIQTIGAARITAKQLGIVGDRDKGVFNVKTDIENLQILGGRAATIDNGVHTGTLTATALGRISEATTDQATGTAVPATDKPIGALSITTGGDLTIFTLNNFAKDPANSGDNNIFDLNGNGASRQPLILKANSITPTPGAYVTAPWTDITLLPFTAGRTIEVRNLPDAAPDPNTTYYLGNAVGLLSQFNPEASLIIGGPGYSGNIFVGSQTSPGNFPLSEQFSLGKMRVTFQTTGRVFNRFSSNQDAPTNWVDSFLLSPPYAPSPAFLCSPGVACLSNITGGRADADVIIIDSLSNGNTTRNVALNGTGTGVGGTLPPSGSTSGGGTNNNNGGGGGGGGSSNSSSSNDSGNSSPGEPGGGGTSGTPGDTTTTVVTAPPSDSNPSTPPAAPGGETSDTDTTTFNTGGTPGPDGGTSTGLAGDPTDDIDDGPGTTITDGTTPGTEGPETNLTDTTGTPPDDNGTNLTDTTGTGPNDDNTTLTDSTNGTGPDDNGTTLTDSTNGNGPNDDSTTLADSTSGNGPDGSGTTFSDSTNGTGPDENGTTLADSNGNGSNDSGTTLTDGSGPADGTGGTGGNGSGFAGNGDGSEGGVGGATLADGSGSDSTGSGLSGNGTDGAGDSASNASDSGLADGQTGGTGGTGSGFARGDGTEGGADGTGSTLAGDGTGNNSNSGLSDGDTGSGAASSGLAGETDTGSTSSGLAENEGDSRGAASTGLAGGTGDSGGGARAQADGSGGTRGEQIAFAGAASGDAASAEESRRGDEGGRAQASAPRGVSLEAQDCVADSQSTRSISRVGADAAVSARGDGVQLDRDSRGCAGAGAAQRNR